MDDIAPTGTRSRILFQRAFTDGYELDMLFQFAAMCSAFSVGRKIKLPDLKTLDFEIKSMKDPNREYFEFEGGNTFSLSTKDLSEDQKDNIYKMVVENVLGGNLVPKQRLPTLYHNLILAGAIKGIRSNTIERYLELVK